MNATPTPCSPEACVQRFENYRREIDELKLEQKALKDTQTRQGERLASIEGRLALAAAFGAVLGGGFVQLIARLFGGH